MYANDLNYTPTPFQGNRFFPYYSSCMVNGFQVVVWYDSTQHAFVLHFMAEPEPGLDGDGDGKRRSDRPQEAPNRLVLATGVVLGIRNQAWEVAQAWSHQHAADTANKSKL